MRRPRFVLFSKPTLINLFSSVCFCLPSIAWYVCIVFEIHTIKLTVYGVVFYFETHILNASHNLLDYFVQVSPFSSRNSYSSVSAYERITTVRFFPAHEISRRDAESVCELIYLVTPHIFNIACFPFSDRAFTDTDNVGNLF